METQIYRSDKHQKKRLCRQISRTFTRYWYGLAGELILLFILFGVLGWILMQPGFLSERLVFCGAVTGLFLIPILLFRALRVSGGWMLRKSRMDECCWFSADGFFMEYQPNPAEMPGMDRIRLWMRPEGLRQVIYEESKECLDLYGTYQITGYRNELGAWVQIREETEEPIRIYNWYPDFEGIREQARQLMG